MAVKDPYTHPALPIRLGVALATRRGRRLAGDPKAMRQARIFMDKVTGEQLPPDELDALARRHLVEMEIRREFFWRTRTFKRAVRDPEQVRPLMDAVATGRGVILSHCHHHPANGIAYVLEPLGLRCFTVAGEGHYKHRPTRRGRRHQRQQHRLTPGPLVRAQGSFDALAERLEQGEVVGLAYDIAGRTPTRFLNQDLHLTSGTARLAKRTGALVVPHQRRRIGHRIHFITAPPFDPDDHEDALDLHHALGEFHDAWIAEYPEALIATAGLKPQLGLKRRKAEQPARTAVMSEA